jgi:(S)-2-hydroxy-acid oxidase
MSSFTLDALVNLSDFQKFAENTLPRNAYDYYASGANDMITLRDNHDAYTRLKIIPRALVDVSNVNIATTVLGSEISMPICVAPTAMQRMAHSDGELATARAAARHNTLMGLSSLSTTSIEDVALSSPGSLKWFQLYVYKDRTITLNLIRRAEETGYLALALTVDTPLLGRREPDIRNKFQLPSHLSMANFDTVGGAHQMGTRDVGLAGSGLASYATSLFDSSLTWDDVKWLKDNTKLKLILKGIMAPEDALLACAHGVDGIWVSNHGARQVDTAPATIDILPEIVAAVRSVSFAEGVNAPEIYVDGGILRGTDVFKALALGARAVFIGRPILWGLSHSGEAGVYEVLRLLREEFILAMKLSGCASISDIKSSFIRSAALPLRRVEL